MPYPTERLGVVFLNLLPASASIAQLAAVQLAIDEVEVHAQAGRQPRNKGQQRLSVRFPGGMKLQHSLFGLPSEQVFTAWTAAARSKAFYRVSPRR
jgi:hypothetical protein